MKKHKKITKIKKKILKNIHFFITFVGMIIVWRGIWSLADHYIIPEYTLLSGILSIAIGISIILSYKKNLKVLLD